MPGKQDWETPPELFDKLHPIFNFTLDAAATAINRKCSRFYSPEDNAFNQTPSGESIWLNPPYYDVLPWAKLVNKWAKSNSIVLLVQDRTDTEWFRTIFYSAEAIRFLYPRVNFVGTETGNSRGSAIFIFGTGELYEYRVDLWNWTSEPCPV